MNANLVISDTALTKAYRTRHEDLQPEIESWEQLRTHLKFTWHGLSYMLQVQGLDRPDLYLSIPKQEAEQEEDPDAPQDLAWTAPTQTSSAEPIATLVWRDTQRCVIESNESHLWDESEGWEYWTLDQVKQSLG